MNLEFPWSRNRSGKVCGFCLRAWSSHFWVVSVHCQWAGLRWARRWSVQRRSARWRRLWCATIWKTPANGLEQWPFWESSRKSVEPLLRNSGRWPTPWPLRCTPASHPKAAASSRCWSAMSIISQPGNANYTLLNHFWFPSEFY